MQVDALILYFAVKHNRHSPTHPPPLEHEFHEGKGKAVPCPPASGLAGRLLAALYPNFNLDWHEAYVG